MEDELEIAIIDPNTLSCLGLQSLLGEIIPQAAIRCFRSFAELADDTPDMYAHYFVSAQTYFEHSTFFLARRPKTIVLTGSDTLPQLSGVATLNIRQDEKGLARSILQLHQRGHGKHHPPHGGYYPRQREEGRQEDAPMLSAREVEVLVLVTRGYINKEIAERLHISLTTVITHRKNISEKLGIKSVSGLAIYAVMHGYVEADSI